jgi:hypothetical protein
VFRAIQEPLYLYRDHRVCERLTTHLPLSVHRRQLKRMMRKHGVPPARIANFVAYAERSFLRQCLYRSRFDRLLKVARGYDAELGWRQPYRRA